MPVKAYPLPEWTPDLANNVLSSAMNVRAIGNGYAPVGAPQAATAQLSPGNGFWGGGAFIDSTGSASLLGATSLGVYKYSGTAWTGPVIGESISSQVRFAQFGDNVGLAHDGAPLRVYNLLTSSLLGLTAAPNAIDVAQIRDFMAVITPDNAVQWCQFNDSAVWTLGANQADKQPTLSGKAVRLIGGEYGILLKDNGVERLAYVGIAGGLDIIFQFDQISAEVGCMAAGSVCNVGRLIFFLSERGFMMCDGQSVEPIADEKFNRWFFSAYSRADIAKIWAAIDPRNSVVMWAMPGTPGTIIAYNWVLKRATTMQVDVLGMFSGYTAGAGLDSLDAIYGNLDAIPISLDDPSLQGGNPILLLSGADSSLYALTGANLEAGFRLDNIEPSPGRRSRVRGLRLITDAVDASATIDARMRAGDSEFIRSTTTMRDNGKLPIRANGRYNSINVTLPAGADWSFIQGVEVEFEAGDGR